LITGACANAKEENASSTKANVRFKSENNTAEMTKRFMQILLSSLYQNDSLRFQDDSGGISPALAIIAVHYPLR
jgi:hypothetical protein